MRAVAAMATSPLLAHADWSCDRAKRWMAVATPTGNRYRASAPTQPIAASMLGDLATHAGPETTVLVGFDFPIGVPRLYAESAGIASFPQFLRQLSAPSGQFEQFFQVATRPNEISLGRPFYPMRPGGTKQEHLLTGLGLKRIDDLRRRCDRSRPGRRAACPMFWTLGGNQVGKGAIAGWREILCPATAASQLRLRLWPFDGDLVRLLNLGGVVVVETYPAEMYDHVGVSFLPGQSKRRQADRRCQARALLDWARSRNVDLEPRLDSEIGDGFGSGNAGEDKFDAVVGLFGMLEVVLGGRAPGEPSDSAVITVEGWMFGQRS